MILDVRFANRPPKLGFTSPVELLTDRKLKFDAIEGVPSSCVTRERANANQEETAAELRHTSRRSRRMARFFASCVRVLSMVLQSPAELNPATAWDHPKSRAL